MADRVKLETEERELLDSYERSEWQSIGALQEQRQQYQSYAAAALEAEGLVSIALPTEDLQAIRRRAAEAGVSYQALIASLVHQFVAGVLIERPRA